MSAPPTPSLLTPRLWLRALHVGAATTGFALLCGFGWFALWLGRAGKASRAAFASGCAVALLRQLGATFVKLGQVMSTRPDLLPEALTRALAHLQDDVGPFPFRDVRRVIERELARPLAALFTEFTPHPIASASIAQVHRARLHDGSVVAVKVRRPGVAASFAFDLWFLRASARLAARLPGLRHLALPDAASQFADALHRQLDLRIEARNAESFCARFRGHPEVIFPEPRLDLSSERVLTMRFIAGCKLSALAGTRVDPRQVARIGLRALLDMVFVHGLVHADLHPGNLLVTPEGKLAFLDLGLVCALDAGQRALLMSFLLAWAKRDGDTMAQLLRSFAAAPPPGAEAFERCRADVIAFVGRYWVRRVGDVQLARVLVELLSILRRHRIRVDPAFALTTIAIALTEGIARSLDPELDLMEVALPFFAQENTRAQPSA